MLTSEKKLVYIISSMRSGSTLLKALLATRPDVSDLPEIDFQQSTILPASSKRIIVMKKPAPYNGFDYPILPHNQAKKIILVRNPYDTVVSLQKMNLEVQNDNALINSERVLVSYWYMVYANILEKIPLKSSNTLIVRYEDLVEKPLQQTKTIFEFIETVDTSGIDHYKLPKNYDWEWESDDGGEVIKSLRVQKIKKEKNNKLLLEIIRRNGKIQFILSQFGYH